MVEEFTRNYMEKLFYFCLKKTGNQTEAEDLTQDIAIHVLTALEKGTVQRGFGRSPVTATAYGQRKSTIEMKR